MHVINVAANANTVAEIYGPTSQLCRVIRARPCTVNFVADCELKSRIAHLNNDRLITSSAEDATVPITLASISTFSDRP